MQLMEELKESKESKENHFPNKPTWTSTHQIEKAKCQAKKPTQYHVNNLCPF